MTAYFAAVDIFEPNGQDRMDPGDDYGGETRLFVLDAETLDAALRTLLAAISAQDTRFDRLHKAGPADGFKDDDFPFSVDMAAMIGDAVAAQQICVSPDYTFSPYGNNETGLCYGLFEFFDPARAKDQPYAGEFTHAACRATNCGEALLAVLDALAADECRLKSVNDFSDANFYDRSNQLQSGTLGDLVSSEDTEGVVWAEGSSIYESDSDD